MQTTRQEYRQFLADNFKGLSAQKSLFYSWDFSLRFDLQVGETDTDEYFLEVVRRASAIFQSAFSSSDNVFLVFMDYGYKRRKIRMLNFVFKQINKLKNGEVFFSKGKRIYETGITNTAIIKLTADRLNYKNILTAIGHSDFPRRQPRLDKTRLDKNGFLTNKEIYFINIDKKLIFHMYDDRGLDLISADIEALRPIYREHNDLILDYDRKQIDKKFE